MGGKVMDLEIIRIKHEAEERGKTLGEEHGKKIGEDNRLIDLVCKKLIKGLSSPEIADALEEPADTIESIRTAASPFDPNNYDVDEIRKKWRAVHPV